MNKDIQDLIEIAKNKKGKVKYTEAEKNSDIQQFLVDNQIKKGYDKVNRQVLYLFYLVHSKKPLEYKDFNRQILRKLGPFGDSYTIDLDNFKYSTMELKKFVVKEIFKNVKKRKKSTRSASPSKK